MGTSELEEAGVSTPHSRNYCNRISLGLILKIALEAVASKEYGYHIDKLADIWYMSIQNTALVVN